MCHPMVGHADVELGLTFQTLFDRAQERGRAADRKDFSIGDAGTQDKGRVMTREFRANSPRRRRHELAC